jgi:hypothetical protein
LKTRGNLENGAIFKPVDIAIAGNLGMEDTLPLVEI